MPQSCSPPLGRSPWFPGQLGLRTACHPEWMWHKSRCKLWNTIQHFVFTKYIFQPNLCQQLEDFGCRIRADLSSFHSTPDCAISICRRRQLPSTHPLNHPHVLPWQLDCLLSPAICEQGRLFPKHFGCLHLTRHQDTSRVDEWPFISEVLRPEAITTNTEEYLHKILNIFLIDMHYPKHMHNLYIYMTSKSMVHPHICMQMYLHNEYVQPQIVRMIYNIGKWFYMSWPNGVYPFEDTSKQIVSSLLCFIPTLNWNHNHEIQHDPTWPLDATKQSRTPPLQSWKPHLRTKTAFCHVFFCQVTHFFRNWRNHCLSHWAWVPEIHSITVASSFQR